MTRATEPQPRTRITRSKMWSGLRAGDEVVVNVPKEIARNYEFVAFARNESTGDEWVEVRGGRAGEGKDRSFRPELIYPLAARRGGRLRGLSLAEAPRLPLG